LFINCPRTCTQYISGSSFMSCRGSSHQLRTHVYWRRMTRIPVLYNPKTPLIPEYTTLQCMLQHTLHSVQFSALRVPLYVPILSKFIRLEKPADSLTSKAVPLRSQEVTTKIKITKNIYLFLLSLGKIIVLFANFFCARILPPKQEYPYVGNFA